MANQLAGLQLVRRIPVQYRSDLGYHQELLAIYDLEVDAGFEPQCDGEIDHPIRVSLDALRDNGAALPLKHSSSIVCQDLLGRYGRGAGVISGGHTRD